MKQFRQLTDFVKYCEQINEKQEESAKFLLVSIFAFSYNKEELLEDIQEALEQYYKWLKVAIDGEHYLLAGCIQSAKEAEIDHYVDLAKQSLKLNIKKDIKTIDKVVKFKLLGY